MIPMNRKTQGRQRGFTLVELMISLLLGLLVIGAAGSMFFSNRKVYGSTEAISRIQENQRSAYEMLARDIREAGGNPCTKNIVNMLDTTKPGGAYFTGWVNGVDGENNTGPNGSDRIVLSNATGGGIQVTSEDVPNAALGVSSSAGINAGDILMVCNSEVAAIFEVTNATGNKLVHNSGEGNSLNKWKRPQIDQCTYWRDGEVPSGYSCPSDPLDSSTDNSTGYCFLPGTPKHPQCTHESSNSPAQVVKPVSVRWYLKDNGRGGVSLYRQEISNGGATAGAENEIAEGVTNLQITYKVGNAAGYIDVPAATDWKNVTAVRVNMVFRAAQGTLTKSDTEGTDNAVITRTLDDYILLRNHQDIQ